MGLEQLPQSELAALGREWLLHGHMQDRVGMPLFLARASREEMEQLAIDEWMLASPVYSRRMQQTLRFEGDSVETIFKNIQMDIGAPHQFKNFRFQVSDPAHGEFWLAHCGALMDVEPMGEDFVTGMCHHIEDPTFDATAAVTNPHAQVRPVHRPPRRPAGRQPHCHWTVTVDPAFPPAPAHPRLDEMLASPMARLPVSPPAGDGTLPGWADYSGPFDPEFVLERLSTPALVAALDEVALQAHLLGRAYVSSLTDRLGYEVALAIGYRVLVGQSALTAQRLQPKGVADLVERHPFFHPRTFLDWRVEDAGDGSWLLALEPCWATEQPDRFGWLAVMAAHGSEPVEVMAGAVDRRARCEQTDEYAYRVYINAGAPPAPDPPELDLMRLSTGAAFRFRN